ncbi:MAG: XRE family transcriptional regulator [Lachnospiraceae bacterium]|nr:XRE family transcriptional regulator [Lachnospiraceae bacterium]
MIYTLRHFDSPVLQFSADSGANVNIQVKWMTKDTSLLPLDLVAPTAPGIESWIRHRAIPKNRAYVNSLLATMGLSLNRPMDIIRVSKGLSLNDCYWVTEEDFDGQFDKYNLYDNRFSRILGLIAFTGHGSSNVPELLSSPEFTTNGMLPKCWRREKGVIRLYKGGTEGAANTGNEPFSEYYAFQIAEILGVNAIPYTLSVWKGKLCSVCTLFTSKELSFVPVGRIVRTGGMSAVRAFYESLGENFTKALNEMIVFDAVIFNTDRHYGNFGFLVDSKTNQIVAPAPLFDHGNALLNYAWGDDLLNESNMWKYANTLLPSVYDDFVSEAKTVLTHEQKNHLRKLLDFRFKRHSRYNLPNKRLSLLEETVSHRVRDLLD